MRWHWLGLQLLVIGVMGFFAIDYLAQNQIFHSLRFPLLPLLILLVIGCLLIVRWSARRNQKGES